MKGIDKVKVHVRIVQDVYLDINEDVYDMPDTVAESVTFINSIRNDVESYIQDVDLAEAPTEYVIESLEIVEEGFGYAYV